MKRGWWIALAACGGAVEPVAPNPPAPPVGQPRRALALVGPEASFDASCRAAGPCNLDGRPRNVDCSGVIGKTAPTLTYEGSGTPIRLAPRKCQADEERRPVAEHFDLYIETQDGVFRSPPLFAIEAVDTRMCGVQLDVRWERRAPLVVANVTVTQQCLSCPPPGKPPAKTYGMRAADFVVVIDPKRRVVYNPVPVAWRSSLEPYNPAGDVECVLEKKIEVARTHAWTPDNRLVVDGAPVWFEPERTPNGWNLAGTDRGAAREQIYSFD